MADLSEQAKEEHNKMMKENPSYRLDYMMDIFKEEVYSYLPRFEMLYEEIRELKGEIEQLWDEVGKARQKLAPLIDLQKDYIKLPDGRWVRKDLPEIRAWLKMVDRGKGSLPQAKKKEFTGIEE